MKVWLQRHLQVFFYALGRLAARPVSTALTLFGIGVALSLPMLLYILVLNFTQVVEGWNQGPRFSLFLNAAVERERAESLAEALAADPEIETTRLITREQGLDELLGTGDLSALRESLSDNPLPDVIEVQPMHLPGREHYRELSQRMARLPDVELVQLDLEWVERLQAMGNIAIRLVMIFWVLLFCGVALVISNSVRLGIMTRRDEIEVISLVGGSNAFIRRPFLYNGVIQAVAGALVGVLILAAVFAFLGPAIDELFDAYGAAFQFNRVPMLLVMNSVVVSALVGWVAAFLTVNRHISQLTG